MFLETQVVGEYAIAHHGMGYQRLGSLIVSWFETLVETLPNLY